MPELLIKGVNVQAYRCAGCEPDKTDCPINIAIENIQKSGDKSRIEELATEAGLLHLAKVGANEIPGVGHALMSFSCPHGINHVNFVVFKATDETASF
jgi:hypothetical protein